MSKQYPRRKYRILGVLFAISFILCSFISNISLGTKQIAFGKPVQQNRNTIQLVNKGIEHYKEGQFRKAIEEWETALVNSQKNNNLSSQAVIRGNLASAYQKLGDLENSIKHWDIVVNLYQQLGKSQETGRAMTELAQAYSNSGKAKKAIQILCGEEAAEINDKETNISKLKPEPSCLQTSALEISRQQKDIEGEILVLGSLGEAYRNLAKYNLAIRYLDTAEEKINQENLALKSKILNSLGNAHLGKAKLWSFYTESAFKGGLYQYEQFLQAAKSYYKNAWNYFQNSYQNSVEQNDKSAQMGALLNLTQVIYRSNQLNLSPNLNAQLLSSQPEIDKNSLFSTNQLEQIKTQAVKLLDKLPESPQKVYAAINLANLSTDSSLTSPLTQCPTKRQFSNAEAAVFLDKAIATADIIQDSRSKSFALGAAGHFYECQNDYNQALTLTRKALLFADYKLQAKDSLYLWQWQQARLLEKLGKQSDAMLAYERAFQTLEKIRGDIITAERDLQLDFRDVIQPLYRKLASLKLDKATEKTSFNQKINKEVNKSNQNNQEFTKAREIINSLRLAELQNYFGNDCITALITPQKVDELLGGEEGKTAVFSSIFLENKAAVLLSLPDKSQHIEWIEDSNNKPISREQLESEINTFLKELRGQQEYIVEDTPQSQIVYNQAGKLYDWIIRPFEDKGYFKQEEIETLVFVQDGLFRSIPMSALIDKTQNKYLIEKYAVAITPSLNLTAPREARKKLNKAMIFGFSEAANIDGQVFEALPYVNNEIASIQELFSNTKLLSNQDFSAKERQKTDDYPIIHIATHAQFGIIPEDTFLVLGDNQKLTIDDLEKSLRKFGDGINAVDLLTLSACETATGDERATLGLAGIALQAGVKSALASLWSVDDKSTSILITEFYQNLRAGESKAKALQQAQLALLRNPEKISEIEGEYKKPYYWSPFILVGNWL